MHIAAGGINIIANFPNPQNLGLFNTICNILNPNQTAEMTKVEGIAENQKYRNLLRVQLDTPISRATRFILM
jgi:hypothetical protein